MQKRKHKERFTYESANSYIQRQARISRVERAWKKIVTEMIGPVNLIQVDLGHTTMDHYWVTAWIRVRQAPPHHSARFRLSTAATTEQIEEISRRVIKRLVRKNPSLIMESL